jgi:hypothetical protein
VSIKIDEELGGEERGEKGVDGVECVRKVDHPVGAPFWVAGIQHVIVLGRNDVDDEVLPERGARQGVRRIVAA